MIRPLLTVELASERDIVPARQRARQVATLLGFDGQDQTRITTAVSELARNAFQYAGGGRVEFLLEDADPPQLLVRVSDRGPGIPHLRQVLDGSYRSGTGMGVGLAGTRRLMDLFEIDSEPGAGTRVTVGKRFTRRMATPTPPRLRALTEALAREAPADAISEIQQQNRELLQALEALRAQKSELEQVNQELEETNRGVVALYAELDERADYLQRVTEIKSRFLSNMTHEFRTPLNSILGLSQILLQRIDGPLSAEQEKQIRYIEQSAEALSELVNDLLDLAKVEAGKLVLRPSEFQVAELFGTLRGMLRPLLARNSAINLVFEEPAGLAPMYSDESKVSQILRNFISNAIKYTERGEVRVSAQAGPGNQIVFAVTDTGIGIALDDQERIFEEFSQVDSPLQQRVKGTGLGLPLTRKLAQLLGGSVRVKSELGRGSTFYAILPAEFRGEPEATFVPEISRTLDPDRTPVLVVEDNAEAMFIYDKYLKNAGYQVLPAHNLREAREWLKVARPTAVILDLLLQGESSWGFLTELREDPRTAGLPVVVISVVENETRALGLGARAFHVKPVDRAWLLEQLNGFTRGQDKLLVVDDDEIARYLLRNLLIETRFSVVEAGDALQGLKLAREQRPQAIFLDVMMPGMDGFGLLRELKDDPLTHDIPVIVHTSKRLSDKDMKRLSQAAAIVPKDSPSREAALAAIRQALTGAGLGPTTSRAPNG